LFYTNRHLKNHVCKDMSFISWSPSFRKKAYLSIIKKLHLTFYFHQKNCVRNLKSMIKCTQWQGRRPTDASCHVTIHLTERLPATARFTRVVLGTEYNLILQVNFSEIDVRVRSNSHSANLVHAPNFILETSSSIQCQ